MATIAADEQIDERPVRRQQKDFDDEQFLVYVEANDAEQMDQNRASIRQKTVTRFRHLLHVKFLASNSAHPESD
jgi:hypothetical protein